MSIDASRLSAALRAQATVLVTLADALTGDREPAAAGTAQISAGVPAAAAEAPRRGRGRPARGESPAPAASAAPAASPAVVESDPFAEAPAAPTVTLEAVRAALVALKDRTDQATALKVLLDAGGAKTLGELKPEKYAAVVEFANGAGAQKPVVEDDPFATPSKPVEDEKVPTVEEVRAVIVETQKRTAADTVQKIVMKHGGKGPNAQGAEAPKLSALPVSKYAEVIAELKALPSTK